MPNNNYYLKTPRHRWQDAGEWDNTRGGMVERRRCARCGCEQRRGRDYTGQRPENRFGWRMTKASEFAAPCAIRALAGGEGDDGEKGGRG